MIVTVILSIQFIYVLAQTLADAINTTAIAGRCVAKLNGAYLRPSYVVKSGISLNECALACMETLMYDCIGWQHNAALGLSCRVYVPNANALSDIPTGWGPFFYGDLVYAGDLLREPDANYVCDFHTPVTTTTTITTTTTTTTPTPIYYGRCMLSTSTGPVEMTSVHKFNVNLHTCHHTCLPLDSNCVAYEFFESWPEEGETRCRIYFATSPPISFSREGWITSIAQNGGVAENVVLQIVHGEPYYNCIPNLPVDEGQEFTTLEGTCRAELGHIRVEILSLSNTLSAEECRDACINLENLEIECVAFEVRDTGECFVYVDNGMQFQSTSWTWSSQAETYAMIRPHQIVAEPLFGAFCTIFRRRITTASPTHLPTISPSYSPRANMTCLNTESLRRCPNSVTNRGNVISGMCEPAIVNLPKASFPFYQSCDPSNTPFCIENPTLRFRDCHDWDTLMRSKFGLTGSIDYQCGYAEVTLNSCIDLDPGFCAQRESLKNRDNWLYEDPCYASPYNPDYSLWVHKCPRTCGLCCETQGDCYASVHSRLQDVVTDFWLSDVNLEWSPSWQCTPAKTCVPRCESLTMPVSTLPLSSITETLCKEQGSRCSVSVQDGVSTCVTNPNVQIQARNFPITYHAGWCRLANSCPSVFSEPDVVSNGCVPRHSDKNFVWDCCTDSADIFPRIPNGPIPSQELQTCLAGGVEGGYNANVDDCGGGYSTQMPEEGTFWCDYCVSDGSAKGNSVGVAVGVPLGIFGVIALSYIAWKYYLSQFFLSEEVDKLKEETNSEGTTPGSIFDFQKHSIEGSDTTQDNTIKNHVQYENSKLKDNEEIVDPKPALPERRNFRVPQIDMMYVPKEKKKHIRKEINWEKELDDMNQLSMFKMKKPKSAQEHNLAEHGRFRLKPRRNLAVNMFLKGTRSGHMRPELEWE